MTHRLSDTDRSRWPAIRIRGSPWCVAIGGLAVWAGASSARGAAVPLHQNLLPNGDLSRLEDGHPVGWEFWDPKYTRVTQLPGRPGNVIEIDQDEYVAAFDGVQVYSDYLPIQEGVRYRFSVDLMTQGASIILWVKGYGPSFYRDGPLEMDEQYRAQHQIHDLKPGQWQRETVHFLVKPPEPYTNIPHKKVTHARVMVYCYWPAQKCYFANARFEAVEIWEPPPAPIVDPATVQEPAKPKERPEPELAQEAKNLFWQGQWAEALELTDKLVQINPRSVLYAFLRFRLYFQVGRFDDCLKEMDRLNGLLTPEDEYVKSWMALFRARIAVHRGQPAEARKFYEQAIQWATDEAAVDQAREELAGLSK